MKSGAQGGSGATMAIWELFESEELFGDPAVGGADLSLRVNASAESQFRPVITVGTICRSTITERAVFGPLRACH